MQISYLFQIYIFIFISKGSTKFKFLSQMKILRFTLVSYRDGWGSNAECNKYVRRYVFSEMVDV